MKKSVIILACALLACTIVLAEEKHENVRDSSVIVEAWLVQVETDALYESGVAPIPQGDEQNVKITNLLWCLSDPNKAKVIASAKTKSLIGEIGHFRLNKTEYITTKSDDSTHINNYAKQTYFEAQSYYYIESKKIRVGYELGMNTFDLDTKTMPEPISVNFKNTTNILAGVPTIVGQSQLDDTSIFLILRAKVEQ